MAGPVGRAAPRTGSPVTGRVRVAAQTPDRQTLAVVGDLEPASVRHEQACLVVSNDGRLTAVPDQPCLLVDDVRPRHPLDGRDGAGTPGRGRPPAPAWPRADSGSGIAGGPGRRLLHVEVPLWHTPWGTTRTAAAPEPLHAGRRDGHRPRARAGGPGAGGPPLPPTQRSVAVRRLVGRDRRGPTGAAATQPGGRPGHCEPLGQQQLRSGRLCPCAGPGPRAASGLRVLRGRRHRRGSPRGVRPAPRRAAATSTWSGASRTSAWPPSRAPVPWCGAPRSGTTPWGRPGCSSPTTPCPWFFRKRPGQVYLQTWHGTPLKRIGTDIPHQRMSTEHYLRLLLSAGPDLGPTSSPRTPFCHRDLPPGVRVRRPGPRDRQTEQRRTPRPRGRPVAGGGAGPRSGVGEDQTVLLYAPTWRDDARRGAAPGRRCCIWTTEAVTSARPDVTVLVRGHPNTAHRSRVKTQSESST